MPLWDGFVCFGRFIFFAAEDGGPFAFCEVVGAATDPRKSYTQKLWMRVKRKAAYLPG